MTAKILKANGEIVHHSTYHGLTPDEILSPVLKTEIETFNESIKQKLGPVAKMSDFSYDVDVETPVYPLYEDDDNGR